MNERNDPDMRSIAAAEVGHHEFRRGTVGYYLLGELEKALAGDVSLTAPDEREALIALVAARECVAKAMKFYREWGTSADEVRTPKDIPELAGTLGRALSDLEAILHTHPTAPDEADLAQALFHTLYDAGISFNSDDLIPRLTATVRALGFHRSREATTEPTPRQEALRDLARDTPRSVTTEPRGITDAEGIERAARRLWEIDYGYLDSWADQPEGRREHYRTTARIALEAVEAAREASR